MMNFFLDVFSQALVSATFREGRVQSGSLLTPAPFWTLKKQQQQLAAWAKAHALAAVDADSYTGVIGRFTVTLITFQRARGALPLRLHVSAVPSTELPVTRDEFAKAGTWQALLEAHANVQRIAAKAEGAEFVLDWNTPAGALTSLLEALEARHQEAQSTYR
jgi:hypothetical protein